MARYWIGTTSTSWNNTNNWSATSGGATGAGVPTSTDDVIIDLNSNANNCLVTTAGMTCQSITITSGFTKIFNVNNTITVRGSVNYGTGTWTLSGGSIMTINVACTFTTNGRTITHPISISGTITFTMADTLIMSNSLSVSNAGGITTFSGSFDITCTNFTILPTNFGDMTTILSGNIIASGLVTLGGSSSVNITTNGTFTITCGGGFSVGCNRTVSGTMSLNITGGVITNTLAGGGFSHAMTLSGTITFATTNTFILIGKSITATTGTYTTAGSSINISSGCVLNTSAITWNNVTLSGTPTLNSILNVSGTLTLGTTTFAGTSGFNTATLSIVTAGNTIILVHGVTYTVTTALTITGTAVSRITFTSDSSGSTAIFTLNSSATQNISFVIVTDIDSTAQQTVWAYKSTLSNALNWNSMVSQITVVKTFF